MSAPTTVTQIDHETAAGTSARSGLFFAVVAILLVLVPTHVLAAADVETEQILVGVEAMMRPGEVRSLQERLQGRVVKRLAGGSVLVVEVPRIRTMSVATAAAMDPDVKFVEPNGLIYPLLVPDDPKYPEQYHLPQIRAPEAWEVTTGSPDVVIAVVDTGVDIDHPDLAGRTIDGWDFVHDSPDPRPKPDPDDGSAAANEQLSHGTLVAGIAAATGNDGWGTAGVDWNAKIMPIKVFGPSGGTTVDMVIEGIDYAIDHGADIINLSVGGGYFEAFTPAIRRAWDAGILVVAAAGNSQREFTDAKSTWESPVCNIGEPGENMVLGVGSTDRHDLRSPTSNYDGSSHRLFVDVMAPGDGIFGPAYYNPELPDFSSYFTTNSGTSFSAPMASGLAALLLSREPGLTPSQLIEQLRTGADSIDALNPGFAGKLGAGRINCARTLGVELAPRPPREVAARDTEDDLGGSITISWQLSPDDGAGANSVTEYIILRRRGTTGEFEETARVPAGTGHYEDTTVDDLVDYYYMVRATDGSLTSDSDVVGPVQAIADRPPPPVEGIYAVDRPDDDGGAIIVGWDEYEVPEEFSHFAIYRSRSRFSSISGMTPIAEVADASATEYVDETTLDGVDYYYAVVAVDEFGNQQTRPNVVGPALSFPNGPVSLSEGLHLFGTPIIPLDNEPVELLETAHEQFQMAKWPSQGTQYDMYAGPGSMPLELGQGYWLKLEHDMTFVPAGNMAPSGSVRVKLEPGWHQLANPYLGPMDMTAATVVYRGTTMDLPSADAANVMGQTFWKYNADNHAYDLVAPFLDVGDSVVAPWQGFWVRVAKQCELILPRPGVADRPEVESTATAKMGDDGWVARLVARGDTSIDRDNFFGVSPRMASIGALSVPPPIGGEVRLSFSDAEDGRTAGAFSEVEAQELNWDLRVAGNPGETVEVWCPNPDEIPRGWSVLLVDEASGQTLDLRHGKRYRFTLRESENERRMTLRLTQSGGLLTLSGMSAQTTGAGGAQLTFNVSASAECTVKVMNMAGRTVRVLEREVLRPAGKAEVLWDGRSDRGLAVPSGMYMFRVEATGEDGTRTQAMRTVSIQR